METMETMAEYKGLTIEIHQDQEPESPRDWDNLGTMIAFHSRYRLGDEHDMSLEEAREFQNRKDIIVLPLYLYDHSGITMRTTPFECQWDSGKVGYIYIELDKAKKEYGWQRLTAPRIEQVKQALINEVKAFDQYLTGDIHGFIIKDKEDNWLDSCWGFYGQEECLSAAQESADAIVETIEAPTLFLGA